MKKIYVLIGSRRRNGNTSRFVKEIVNKLDKNEYVIEIGFPDDYSIKPCAGCGNCFTQCKCVNEDDIGIIQNKILESDLFIIASPVYIHYFTGELKMIVDKLSWWAHTLRLQGKPVVILSTCATNGHMTVIKALGEIIGYMGGNVIATCNAAEMPCQITNDEWMDEVSGKIAERIEKYINLPAQSNKEIERIFENQKIVIKLQKEIYANTGIHPKEYEYWVESGMINYDSFGEYLEMVSGGKKTVESSFSATM